MKSIEGIDINYERKRHLRALLFAFSLLIMGFVHGCGESIHSPAQPSAIASQDASPAGSPEPEHAPALEDERREMEARLASPAEPLVAVFLGNTLYAVRPLNKADTIHIDQGDGKRNEVCITGTSVYMSHATCENQDCVEQSAVTLENYDTRVLSGFIICLPNSVTVELIPGPVG